MFASLIPGPTPQCINFEATTSGITTSFTLLPLLLIVLAVAALMATLGGISLKGKMNSGIGGLQLGPSLILLFIGITLVIVIGIYLVAEFQAAGIVAFGC